ncbi:hypothetical protein AQ490_23125 [Wenjunlia vitaminophila]|uniref:Secreted protein n=1 Tax=Wenjunlia vitaminophila TaxID=76728 RepID=A0A0T6LSE0_WENVI|nr:hypothetical protein [Wenjunlia vitaminophila]KRV48767.1 hypothetical protein AQ490_23125 [Wenjunlia vitaminophila]
MNQQIWTAASVVLFAAVLTGTAACSSDPDTNSIPERCVEAARKMVVGDTTKPRECHDVSDAEFTKLLDDLVEQLPESLPSSPPGTPGADRG